MKLNLMVIEELNLREHGLTDKHQWPNRFFFISHNFVIKLSSKFCVSPNQNASFDDGLKYFGVKTVIQLLQ